MSKLVFGVGVNDGSRPTKIDGKKVKAYALWQYMLKRCFSESYKHVIKPIKVVVFLLTF